MLKTPISIAIVAIISTSCVSTKMINRAIDASFIEADKNKDNYISLEELTIQNSLGTETPEEKEEQRKEAIELFQKYDINKDGKLSKEEYLQLGKS